MTSLRQFDRTCRLTIAELGDPFGLLIEYAQDLGLRIAFDILKTNDLQPNRGSVTIWNLAEDTRSDLTGKVKRLIRTTFGQGDIDGRAQADPKATAFALGTAYVTLSAGYGPVPIQVMEGNTTGIKSVRRGVDWTTTLTFGDSELQARGSIVNRSFAIGTPFATVILYLVASLGVSFDPAEVTAALAASPTGRTDFPHGVTIVGPAIKNLDRLLKNLDIKASIQDGKFQVLNGNGTTNDPPILMSLENGLLDAPRALDDGGYEIRSFVTGELSPGRPLTLETAAVQGLYRVEEVRHRGDTHGADWHSVTEIQEPLAVDIG